MLSDDSLSDFEGFEWPSVRVSGNVISSSLSIADISDVAD